MAHNYDTFGLLLKANEDLRMQGHYEFKSKGRILKKVIHLIYKVIECPEDEISAETFMHEYIDKIVNNGLLKIQSNSVTWRKIVVTAPTIQNPFNYMLHVNTKGILDGPIKTNAFYQFEIQNMNNNRSFLNVYGITSNIEDNTSHSEM